MGRKTGIIKFNLADRMRKHRGQERNFDIEAAVRLINSGSVQERVKHGDMVGYFGHWPRVKFGLDPDEGGFLDGKQVSLEPAIRTVLLKAYPDGTVEHEQEFLDTASGKVADRVHGSKAYGFSSAMDSRRLGGKTVPTGFFGFDLVREPNYTANRGYAMALDGVMDQEDVLDAVAERDALFDEVNKLLDSAAQDTERAMQVVDRLSLENEQLYSMLMKYEGAPKEVTLDGCLDVVHGSKASPLLRADEFMGVKLTPYEKEDGEPEKKSASAADRALTRALR